VTDAQNHHCITADLEQDAVDAAALTMEELPQLLAIPRGFGRLGAALRVTFQRFDCAKERVPPALGCRLRTLG
jgi:hypothetical protein